MRGERITIPSFAPTAAGARVPTLVRPPRGLLGDLEAAIVQCIDGATPVAEIARRIDLSVPEVTAVVRSLETLGLVRFVDIIELAPDDLIFDEEERITLPNADFDRPTRPNAVCGQYQMPAVTPQPK